MEFNYVYSFYITTSGSWSSLDPRLDVFFGLLGRVRIIATEPKFQEYRTGLEHHHFRLVEIERTPYLEPEPIV